MTAARVLAALLLAAGVASAAPAEDIDAWVKKTSGLKAEDQVAAFRDKMKALNPKLEVSDKVLLVETKKGVVTSVTIPAAYAETIAPVALFRDLERLQVTGRSGVQSEVKDLSPLKGMTRLKELSLAATKVADLKPLAALPLKSLTLNHTDVTDLDPLKAVPLDALYLNSTAVKSLAALKDMPLTAVEIPAGVEAKQLEVLAGKPLRWFAYYGRGPDQKQFDRVFASAKLETFRLEDAPVLISLEPLRGMPLKNLILPHVPKLKDAAKKPALGPLDGCADLRQLTIGKADFADLSPLAGKPLDRLTIADAPNLRDISPLKGANLIYLSLYRTAVGDLSALSKMDRLHTLYLGGLKLKSLKPLEGPNEHGLPGLRNLDLAGASVADKDSTPLTKLKLTGLWIDVDQTTAGLVKKIPTLETLNGKSLTR